MFSATLPFLKPASRFASLQTRKAAIERAGADAHQAAILTLPVLTTEYLPAFKNEPAVTGRDILDKVRTMTGTLDPREASMHDDYGVFSYEFLNQFAAAEHTQVKKALSDLRDSGLLLPNVSTKNYYLGNGPQSFSEINVPNANIFYPGVNRVEFLYLTDDGDKVFKGS